jgi:N-acetyl-anhydromuramyl-L-alanine amidase AmpD
VPKELIGYTNEQYEALTALLLDISQRWDIEPDRAHVIGHEEYNPAKPDPGELFDWSRVIASLSQ